VDWTEGFSRVHPVNAQIKDTDVFIHGTSSTRFSVIKLEGLKRKVDGKHFGISHNVICFEKLLENKHYRKAAIDLVKKYCQIACDKDNSSEGVILQIKGRELKKLGCPIYADWNIGFSRKTIEGIPFDINLNAPVSIIIVDRDIPFEYLEV